jgi:hypothetical protein
VVGIARDCVPGADSPLTVGDSFDSKYDAYLKFAHRHECVIVVRSDSKANGICVFSHEALNQEVPECYHVVNVRLRMHPRAHAPVLLPLLLPRKSHTSALKSTCIPHTNTHAYAHAPPSPILTDLACVPLQEEDELKAFAKWTESGEARPGLSMTTPEASLKNQVAAMRAILEANGLQVPLADLV